jgi:N-acetylglucosamine repressor
MAAAIRKYRAGMQNKRFGRSVVSVSNIDVKRINKIRILRCIIKNGKISQQDIATMLGVSIPTVLQNVKELLGIGLIQEVGVFQSTGGRKAKAIAPIPVAKYAIGLDITQNHISTVLVELDGQILEHTRVRNTFSCEEGYFQHLGLVTSKFIRKHNIPRNKILGVGISIPGIVDNSGQRIASSHALGISDVSCSTFCKDIPYPCIFVNDANAAGYAELRDRDAAHNAVYLSLSDSVGGAIFLNDRLYLGENQRSGEIGHNTLIPGGKRCYCGKYGCLDAYCSAKALSQHSSGDLSAFFETVKSGDDALRNVLEEYFGLLTIAINNLRMTFDCDIIVGGYVGGYLEDYLRPLRNRLALLNAMELDGEYLQVCRYKLEASALGAALQHIDAFVDGL